MYLKDIGSVLAKNKYEILQNSVSFCILGRREPTQDKFIIVVNNYGHLLKTKYDIEKVKGKIKIGAFYSDSKNPKFLFVLRQVSDELKFRIRGSKDILYYADNGNIKCVNCEPCFYEEICQICAKGNEEKNRVKLRQVNSPWIGTNTPIITILLCVICLTVFILGMDASKFGVSPSNLFEQKRWNTLITYMFLHGNILHLLGNILSMTVWGSGLEKKIGSIKYMFLCLISGVYGGLISSIFKSIEGCNETVTVGLSGIVYAVMGAYLVYQIRNKRAYGFILSYILLSFLLGFLQRSTDNFVHGTGLIFGIYCMAIFYLLKSIHRFLLLTKCSKKT